MTIDSNNKSFCPLPWMHLHSWPDGKSYLCCVAGTGTRDGEVADLTTESLAKALNNDRMKKVRLDMLNGVPLKQCEGCYKSEDLYGHSFRTNWLKDYQHKMPDLLENMNPDGSLKDPKLLYMDFRFSNLCNLECRSCGEGLSSKIHERKIKLHKIHPSNMPSPAVFDGTTTSFLHSNPAVLEEIKNSMDNVTRFYFAGGEPLIQDSHNDILQTLIAKQQTNVELVYSTNLTVLKYKSTDFLEAWKKFRGTVIYGSLDDIGPRVEYIRFRSNWERMRNNILSIQQAFRETHGRIRLHINQVVSIFNIYYIPEFLTELHNMGLDIRQRWIWSPAHILGSTWMHPSCLPEEMKKEVEDKLNNFSDNLENLFGPFDTTYLKDKIQEFITDMRSHNYSTGLFLHYVNMNDKDMGTDYKQTFPWLAKIEDYRK